MEEENIFSGLKKKKKAKKVEEEPSPAPTPTGGDDDAAADDGGDMFADLKKKCVVLPDTGSVSVGSRARLASCRGRLNRACQTNRAQRALCLRPSGAVA